MQSKFNFFRCFMNVSLLLFVALTVSCNNSKNNIDWGRLREKYSKVPNDSLKLKSVLFLLENINNQNVEIPAIQSTSNGSTLSLFDLRSKGLNKDSVNKLIKSEQYIKANSILRDKDILTTEFVDQNVSIAVDSWKKSKWFKDVSDEIFLNYVLPYKIYMDHPSDWRNKVGSSLVVDYNRWERGSSITYSPNEPDYIDSLVNQFVIPQQFKFYHYSDINKLGLFPSFEEIEFDGGGDCYSEAALHTYLLRSESIPAAFNFIPCWGGANGTHAFSSYWNAADAKMRLISGLKYNAAKIYRNSFKPINIWSREIEPYLNGQHFELPFLANDFVLDVTNQYVETSDLEFLIRSEGRTDLSYLCVLNYENWVPIAWARVLNGKALFKNMGRNILYRTAVPSKHNGLNFGDLFLLDSLGKMHSLKKSSQKNIMQLHSINSGSESFVKSGHRYLLSYLNNTGELIPIKSADCIKDKVVIFEEINKASIYILTDLTSTSNLSRPFTYSKQGQFWY